MRSLGRATSMVAAASALLIEGDDGTSLGRREIAAAFHHADFNQVS